MERGRITDHGDDLGELTRSVALHYRKHIEWEKASEAACLDLLSVLCERTAADHVLIASDDDKTAMRLAEKVRRMGLRVEVLGLGSGLKDDLDRDEERVLEFVKAWKTLSRCPWAITNAIASTVLDASRALGNEVWTFGDLAGRLDHRCALFQRFGFDWLVAGPTQKVSESGEGVILTSFVEKGRKLISYCLFGNEEVYVGGCLRNLEEAREVYPGWQVLVFMDESVGIKVREEIAESGGVVLDVQSGLPLTVERCLPALDKEVDFVLVRDADSSLLAREAIAVKEWIES